MTLHRKFLNLEIGSTNTEAIRTGPAADRRPGKFSYLGRTTLDRLFSLNAHRDAKGRGRRLAFARDVIDPHDFLVRFGVGPARRVQSQVGPDFGGEAVVPLPHHLAPAGLQ